jgi:hypothetical protein
MKTRHPLAGVKGLPMLRFKTIGQERAENGVGTGDHSQNGPKLFEN